MEFSPLAAKVRGGSGLVVEDLLDLLHDLVRQLGQQLQGLAVFADLARLGSSQDDGADVLVLDGPGDGQRSRGAAQALGDLGQLANLCDLGLALLCLQLLDGAVEKVLVGREPAVLGDALVVLAGKEARRKRRPDGGAIAKLLENRCVLDLKALAVESWT
jgi:hypothetical protein